MFKSITDCQTQHLQAPHEFWRKLVVRIASDVIVVTVMSLLHHQPMFNVHVQRILAHHLATQTTVDQLHFYLHLVSSLLQKLSTACVAWWHSGYSVGLSTRKATGSNLGRFRFQVTTLGKLFTHVPLSPSSIIWYRLRGGEWWDAGVVICLERGADVHTAHLMPLPVTVSCFSKIQIGFTFLVPAHLGSPGKGPLNGCVFS